MIALKNEQVALQWTMGKVENDNAGGVYLLVKGWILIGISEYISVIIVEVSVDTGSL